MIYLTSNGITSESVLTHLKQQLDHHQKAVIITTASLYKNNDRHIPEIRKTLASIDLEVDLLDIECEDINRLCAYDVVYLLGGNPFYLLHYLRIHNIKDIFLQFIRKKNIIIGASAGSVVLTPSIGLIHEFDPDMNIHGYDDLSALNLVDFEVCPHYERFRDKYHAFHERCDAYDAASPVPLYKLQDGEAYFIETSVLKIGG